MKLIALMAARDESWVIGLSLRAALKWCDEVIVLAHCCTDDTINIVIDAAEEKPGHVHLMVEDNPVWAEMHHRQAMLEKARQLGATHIAYVDADEVLTGNLLPLVRPELEEMPPGGYLRLSLPCLWRSLYRYRTDGLFGDKASTMVAFRDDGKVGWQPGEDGYQFHSREPRGAKQFSRADRGMGGVMHLQFVDWRRLISKHKRYKLLERVMYPQKPVADIDKLYSYAPNETGLQTADVPAEWWEPYRDLIRHVDLNQKPWQEEDCERMLMEHGAEYFEGLDLFYNREQVAAQ